MFTVIVAIDTRNWASFSERRYCFCVLGVWQLFSLISVMLQWIADCVSWSGVWSVILVSGMDVPVCWCAVGNATVWHSQGQDDGVGTCSVRTTRLVHTRDQVCTRCHNTAAQGTTCAQVLLCIRLLSRGSWLQKADLWIYAGITTFVALVHLTGWWLNCAVCDVNELDSVLVFAMRCDA